MRSRVITIVCGLVAAAAMACVDLAAPKNTPASISLLQVPTFFIVRGDVMRDSLGNPAKPNVLAYDASGSEATGFTPSFFITDSNAVAHFDANGVLVGDRIGTVRFLGQIGSLQTPVATIYVTTTPLKIAAAGKTDSIVVPVTSDSSTSMGTASLAVTVRGLADSAIGGAIVRYAIVPPVPASKTGTAAVYLANDLNNLSTVDTTDAQGSAARRLIVNSRFLADAALLSGQKKDSVIVEARTKYRGAELSGSPVRFVVHIRIKF